MSGPGIAKLRLNLLQTTPETMARSWENQGRLCAGYCPIYIAYEKGYLRSKAGCGTYSFDSGAKMVAALGSGQLDVEAERRDSFAQAIDQGFDVQVVMGTRFDAQKDMAQIHFWCVRILYDSARSLNLPI